MNRRRAARGFLLCLVLASACSPQPAARTGTMPELDAAFAFGSLLIVNDEGRQVEFDVYLARDVEQQRRGLMFVRNMPERTGMLFIYDDEAIRSMWMKNTYIPLDIVFARGDGRVASINRDTVPLTLTSRTSTEPVRYVLELNAGTARRFKIGKKSRLVVESVDRPTARRQSNRPGS